MNLYNKVLEYDEELTKHYLKENMTKEQMLKTLSYAWWEATNFGYNEHMAGRLMAGESSSQIDEWEYACKNKYSIYALCEYLKEIEEE